MPSSSDVAFSPAVKAVQEARGSRAAYARMEAHGGFETAVSEDLAALLGTMDTAFLATANAAGQPYVQHRGGPRGFIRVVDAQTLAIAEQPGNRQYVTAGNLTENPRVCLIAIDYAHRRRVKIWGTARHAPPDVSAGAPEGVLVISVEAWDVNCPKYIPQKVDVADVTELVGELRARIAMLEAELAAARA